MEDKDVRDVRHLGQLGPRGQAESLEADNFFSHKFTSLGFTPTSVVAQFGPWSQTRMTVEKLLKVEKGNSPTSLMKLSLFKQNSSESENSSDAVLINGSLSLSCSNSSRDYKRKARNNFRWCMCVFVY